MKKNKVAILLSGALVFGLGVTEKVFAWNYTDYSNGSYVPKNGSGSTGWSGGTTPTLGTTIKFKLDSNNVSSIKDYNNGGENPGDKCDNVNAYLTLDQTAIPDSWDLEIDGHSVYTNLPNPKIDIESNIVVGEDDETEVTVLGTVSANVEYYMTSFWTDYRDGDSGDGGKIQAQFAISKKGVSDYNNCTQSSKAQHTFIYGNNTGSFSLLKRAVDVKKTGLIASNDNIYITKREFDAISLYTSIEENEQSLKNYVDSKRRDTKKIKDLNISNKNVAVTITFANPLTYSEVLNLVNLYGIEVDKLQARTIDSNGDRGTYAINGLSKVKEIYNTFLGYTDLSGYIMLDNIDKINSDNRVYLVDASGDKKLTKLEKDGFPLPLTWKLEDVKNKK